MPGLALLGKIKGEGATSLHQKKVGVTFDVLARETIAVAASAATAVIDYLCRVSHQQEVHFLWRPYLQDPKDDLVLELAVASRSAVVVTYNVKDFDGAARFGVRIVRPAEFLAELGVES